MHEHPPIDNLARFSQGLLPPGETALVAIHVARCETCRTATTRPDVRLEAGPATYGEAIHRVAGKAAHWAARHERDKRRAPGALDQILALPAEDWNRAIRSSSSYHSYAFAQHALEQCKTGWSDDPHRSERLAQLALEVANRLPNREHHRRNLDDLRARAWAYTANCRRIRTDLLSVPEALGAAMELHHSGNASARSRMMLLSLTTSFLSQTMRFQEAYDLILELDELAHHLKDQHSLGKNRWAACGIYLERDQMDDAVGTIEDARRLMTERRERGTNARLKMVAANVLATAGDLSSALAAARAITPGDLELFGRVERLRLTWTKAMILWGRGDLQRALSELYRCRQGFLHHGIPGEVARLDLEIAEIHLELGNRTRALATVTKAFRSFALEGLEQRTLAALDLFRQAGGVE